jgi:HSP20 family protein
MFFAPAIRHASAVPSSLGAANNAFERFMGDMFAGLRSPWDDVQEDEKSWTVTLDLPGVTREQLQVSTEGRLVRIETSPEAKRQFKGVYEMAQAINPEGCEAKLENGVLTLKLTKQDQASTNRQISVS